MGLVPAQQQPRQRSLLQRPVPPVQPVCAAACCSVVHLVTLALVYPTPHIITLLSLLLWLPTSCCRYNGAVNEHQYAATLVQFFGQAGFANAHVVIDTGRAGVPGMRTSARSPIPDPRPCVCARIVLWAGSDVYVYVYVHVPLCGNVLACCWLCVFLCSCG